MLSPSACGPNGGTSIPAIVHVDGTARVQTVRAKPERPPLPAAEGFRRASPACPCCSTRPSTSKASPSSKRPTTRSHCFLDHRHRLSRPARPADQQRPLPQGHRPAGEGLHRRRPHRKIRSRGLSRTSPSPHAHRCRSSGSSRGPMPTRPSSSLTTRAAPHACWILGPSPRMISNSKRPPSYSSPAFRPTPPSPASAASGCGPASACRESVCGQFVYATSPT